MAPRSELTTKTRRHEETLFKSGTCLRVFVFFVVKKLFVVENG